MLGYFVINLLNSKTIIRRYSERFRRIIVKINIRDRKVQMRAKSSHIHLYCSLQISRTKSQVSHPRKVLVIKPQKNTRVEINNSQTYPSPVLIPMVLRVMSFNDSPA